jgi:hypothetical protein
MSRSRACTGRHDGMAARSRASVGDATAVERSLEGEVPLVVVNPPRRGLGVELAQRTASTEISTPCTRRSAAARCSAKPPTPQYRSTTSRRVHGVEISVEAVEAARQAAAEMGLPSSGPGAVTRAHSTAWR